LAAFLNRLLLITHEQHRITGGFERLKNCGKSFRAHRAHDGHVETFGIQIAAQVTAHQGKCRNAPFALPTVHNDAGEFGVI